MPYNTTNQTNQELPLYLNCRIYFIVNKKTNQADLMIWFVSFYGTPTFAGYLIAIEFIQTACDVFMFEYIKNWF